MGTKQDHNMTMTNETDRLLLQPRKDEICNSVDKVSHTTENSESQQQRRAITKTIYIVGIIVATICVASSIAKLYSPVVPKFLSTFDVFAVSEESPTALCKSPPAGGRTYVSSGTVFEERYGYSRAVRAGNSIHVSGTVAAGPEGLIDGGKGNATKQTQFTLTKIRKAIEELGGTIDDVVRTRIYVTARDYALDVAAVHGEVFKDTRPANTLVLVELIEEEYLVEIEAEAIVGSSSTT